MSDFGVSDHLQLCKPVGREVWAALGGYVPASAISLLQFISLLCSSSCFLPYYSVWMCSLSYAAPHLIRVLTCLGPWAAAMTVWCKTPLCINSFCITVNDCARCSRMTNTHSLFSMIILALIYWRKKFVEELFSIKKCSSIGTNCHAEKFADFQTWTILLKIRVYL